MSSKLVRQRAEEELKKLASAVQQTANCVLIADRRGVIEYVNPAFERTTGYAREDVIGKTPRLLKSGKHDQKYYETLWSTILAGGTFFAEIVNRKKSGELYHSEQTISAIRDSQGHVTHFVSTGRDITERKRAEEAIKLFRALVDQSNDTIEVVDPETGRFLDINEKGHLALGYSREEILSLSVFDIDPMVDQSVFPRAVEELRKSGVLTWEGNHRRKDGSTFPVEVNLKYVRLDRDYVVAAVRDITERKRAEDPVRQLAAIVESSDDAILSRTLEGTILSWNRAAERIYGYRADEVIGKPISILCAPERPEELKQIVESLRRAERLEHFETIRLRKDGKRIHLSLTVSPLKDSAGNVVGGSTIARDITERKRAEARMQMLSREIIAAREEERKQVASILHHDVGSLAVGISAHLGAIEKELRSGKPREALQWMKRTRKLFDASVVRLKKLASELRPPELDVLGLSAALRHHFAQVTERGGIRIHFREALRRRRLSSDTATILFRVAQEALTNAIRHGHATRVDVDLSASKKEIRLTVRNNGKAFHPRQKTARATVHLGLRVMQEMAAAAGGAFTIDSGRGKRTTVCVCLPLKQAIDY